MGFLMRCAICNTEDDNIHYDPVTKTFTDCYVCKDVIYEALLDYDANEEDDDELLEEEDHDGNYDYGRDHCYYEDPEDGG